MTEEVKNYQVDRKYRVIFEQAASTKGVLGFKVEVNGDDMVIVEAEATALLEYARNHAPQLTAESK